MQRGIKLAALQSSGVFDPRGSLARGNKAVQKSCIEMR